MIDYLWKKIIHIENVLYEQLTWQ